MQMAAVGAATLLLAARADGDPASDVLPGADVFAYAPEHALVSLAASVNTGGNPAGVGVWNGGRPLAAEREALAGLPKAPLAAVAEEAVRRLAAARLLHYTDVLPPLVYALPGGQYAVSDGSGRAAVGIAYYAGLKRVATAGRPLAVVNPAAVYSLKHVARATRFCITAVDAAGNRSSRACAPV